MPSAPVAPSDEEPSVSMQVNIPPDVTAGDKFLVGLPDGSQLQVPCPPNVQAGDTITIRIPTEKAIKQAVSIPKVRPDAPPPAIVTGGAVTAAMREQALQFGTKDPINLLDAETAGILASVNSFKVQQRVSMWEAASLGMLEQQNIYDFFDAATGMHLFIAQEESDGCVRCGCAPHHSLRVNFKLVNSKDRLWSTRAAIDSMPIVFHLEREGCCSKKWLCCFTWNDSCKDGMTLNAGSPPAVSSGQPGGLFSLSQPDRPELKYAPEDEEVDPYMPLLLNSTIAYADQPACGGYLTPTINLFTRVNHGIDPTAFAPLAKIEGPTIFGGCSELCCDAFFQVSRMEEGQEEEALKTGDLATITKTRPRGAIACAREIMSDSDHFLVKYEEGVGLTPQQKASMMGIVLLSDYMFFEHDQAMLECDDNSLKVTFLNCYCCGSNVPCKVGLQKSGGGGDDSTYTGTGGSTAGAIASGWRGGGGGPPGNERMER